MSTVKIDDLNLNEALDRQAMLKLRGGVMARAVVRNGEVVLLGCTELTRFGDRPVFGDAAQPRLPGW